MPKNLVIVESPSKCSSYKKALGNDFNIIASRGHCVDLPAKGLNVDVKKDFAPTFKVLSDKKDVIKDIKSAAVKVDNVYLCMDSDREGEGIAQNIYDQIKNTTKAKIYRASTNEITKSGIKKAINEAGKINKQMVEAYVTRRILDRLAGYKASYPIKTATGGPSAGRVQSAVLRVIVDRENEILSFIPEEYWILTAHFLSEKKEKYVGLLEKKIKVKNAKQAQEIYDKVIKGKPLITSVIEKQVISKPVDPFTFIRMCGTTSNQFGWSASRTMKVSQALYEAGHITYMRTDSRHLAKEAVDSIRDYIKDNFAATYLPATVNKYASKKGAQEAHEACRPTDIKNVNPPGMDTDQQRLYTMIWKRTVACQMTPAVDKSVTVVTEVSKYNFVSSGKTPVFDGYRVVWTYTSPDFKLLPPLAKGEHSILDRLDKIQHFTKPPPRYSTASLGALLEKLQIARPATFASFLDILKKRGYMDSGKTFKPTQLGMDVIAFMKKVGFCFVDTQFTAHMEQLLDDIAGGNSERSQVLTDFWVVLQKDIEKSKEIKKEQEKTKYKCPKCGAILLLKYSRFGKFFSCSEYKGKDKGCDYTAKVGEHGEPVEKKVVKKIYAAFNCSKCGKKVVQRTGKYGIFFGCSGFPTCRTIFDEDGNIKVSKKKWGKKKA